MPFREKRAWISFACIFIITIVYFTYLIMAYGADIRPSFDYLTHMAFIAIVAFAILEVGLHLGLYLVSPPEDKMPRDERELLIAARATRNAYVSILILSFLAALLIVHHNGFNWLMGNTVLLAMALAELIKHGSQIFYYRRGI